MARFREWMLKESKASRSGWNRGSGVMSEFGIALTGDDAVAKMCEDMPPAVFRRISRSSALKAMRPVAKAAKANAKAHRRTGQYEKSIGVKTKTYKRSGTVWVGIGPRHGYRVETTVTRILNGKEIKETRAVDPTKYAHLVELGTQPHSLGKGSNIRKGIQIVGRQHPGSEAMDILKRALESNAARVIQALSDEMVRGVEQESKKAAKGKAA
jgi:HK97 gp10 family phage protein